MLRQAAPPSGCGEQSLASLESEVGELKALLEERGGEVEGARADAARREEEVAALSSAEEALHERADAYADELKHPAEASRGKPLARLRLLPEAEGGHRQGGALPPGL